MKLEADVCIVGAGPGGALLSYLLAKQKITSVLVERHSDINKEFRGEHLNHQGEAILKNEQLYDKVASEGLLFMKQIDYYQNGQVFKTVRPKTEDGHVGIHVPQRNLLNVILTEASRLPAHRFLHGTRVTDLLLNEQGQVSGVKAINGNQEVTIKSSMVVGADGRFSTIRKLAGIPYKTIKHGYDLLWAKMPAPDWWEPTIKNALVDDQQLALFTQAGGYIQIGWNIKEGTYGALRKQSFAPFIAQAIKAFPELTETIQANIQSWDDFVLLNVQSIICETWVKDGLAIIGDAAHTMSPTGAFGLNSALADAEALADVAVAALSHSDFSEAQLKEFERSRREEIENLHKQQLLKEAEYKNEFAISILA